MVQYFRAGDDGRRVKQGKCRRDCIVYYSVYLHYIAWNHYGSTGKINGQDMHDVHVTKEKKNGGVCTEVVNWKINDVVDIGGLADSSWVAVVSSKDCCWAAESQRDPMAAVGTYRTILDLCFVRIDWGWCCRQSCQDEDSW